MPKPSLFLALICVAAAFSPGALATPFDFSPSDDTFVSSGNPTTNYGSMGAMQVSAPGTHGELQSLLKFDFSGATASFDLAFGPGNWVIDGITLQLGTNTGMAGVQPGNMAFNPIAGGAFKIDLLANTSSWTESTATWNTLGSIETPGQDVTLANASTSGSTFTYTPPGSNTAPPVDYGIGLNSTFLGDITSNGTAGFRMYAGDTSVGYLFNSKEYITPANHPVLIVDVVPEPAVTSLLLLSVCGLLARRRRSLA